MARRTTRGKTGRAAKGAGKRRIRGVVGAVSILVLAGLAYAWSAGRVINLGYEISSLQADLRQAYDLNRKLRVELASLRRPELVEKIARSKLGLVRPPAGRVVVLR